MRHLTDAVRSAVAEQNWYAALGLALMLPDICGGMESDLGSRARYVAWFDRYLLPKYVRPTPFGDRAALSGQDCYALRCAFLHQGEFALDHKRARQALSAFQFTPPPPTGNRAHMNQCDSVLQLQVDIFAEEVCAAVDAWLDDVRGDASIQSQIAELGRISLYGDVVSH